MSCSGFVWWRGSRSEQVDAGCVSARDAWDDDVGVVAPWVVGFLDGTRKDVGGLFGEGSGGGGAARAADDEPGLVRGNRAGVVGAWWHFVSWIVFCLVGI